MTNTNYPHSARLWILAFALLASCSGQHDDSQDAMPSVEAAAQQDHAHQDGHALEDDEAHEDDPAQEDAHKHDDGHGHDAKAEADHNDEIMLTPEAITRYGIQTQVAKARLLKSTITAPARVGFNTEAMAHVGSPIRGRIAEVHVRIGDPVKVGQVLAVIESPELGEAQAEFLQRGVSVQTAGPAVELSRIAWERARGLYEKSRGISLTEVQRREAEHKVALAALEAAESARKAAANRLRLLGMNQEAIDLLASSGEVVARFSIRAAIDGIVVQREITLGELVGPDREYLMVLANATDLWVLADVPEAQLLRVEEGAEAWISVGSLGDSGGKRFQGEVAFISPFVDSTTRTAQVRIEVPTTELGLRPGMFAQAEIVEIHSDGPHAAPVVAVPEDAIQTIGGEPTLFVPVAGEPNTYATRAVTLGRAVGGFVPVLSGLTAGELFVSEGTFILKADLGKGAAAHEH